MFTRDFSGIFITITVEINIKYYFHHYPKDNFLTSDYMGNDFYLQMTFPGPVFSTPFAILPQMLRRSLGHCKVVSKNFGPIFFFREMIR